MTFVQQRNSLMTHFSESIPVIKRHMTAVSHTCRPNYMTLRPNRI